MNAAPVIFVVDDDTPFLNAVARLLLAGGYQVKTYTSADEFLKCHPADTPGCVVVDLRMPGSSGLDLQSALAKSENPLPVIFLTGRGDISSSVRAMKDGAEDFLTKPVKREDLFDAVQRALARNARDREMKAKARAFRTRYETLTPREREVMTLVVAGKLNKQIAAELGTVERTIKAHRAQVMQKMQVESVAELVRIAGDLSRAAGTGISIAAK